MKSIFLTTRNEKLECNTMRDSLKQALTAKSCPLQPDENISTRSKKSDRFKLTKEITKT